MEMSSRRSSLVRLMTLARGTMRSSSAMAQWTMEEMMSAS
jgi:hypothetical protein